MKLLFSLLLSGLIVAPLASFAKFKTNTGRVIEFKPQQTGLSGNKAEEKALPVNLNPTRSLTKAEITAYAAANEVLPIEAKKLLNETAVLLLEKTSQKGEVVESVPMNLLIENASSINGNLAMSGKEPKKHLTALSNAVRLSVKETWPQENAVANLSKHITRLADTIDSLLGIKQEEVEARCRV